MIQFASLILAAYLLGSVPAAYLAARWSRGIDIRQYGSGNVGASNLRGLVPTWVFVAITIFDLGKGMAAVWVAQLIGLGAAQQVTVGLAAIIGHSWPVFLCFNGGRSVLTTMGVIAILVPWLAPVVLVIALSFAPFHQLALGVFLAALFSPVAVWFFGEPLGTADRLPVALGLLAMFLVLVVRRLTAPRTLLSASVPAIELLTNRLLFDRDIRDREAWIHQAPPVSTTGHSFNHKKRKRDSHTK